MRSEFPRPGYPSPERPPPPPEITPPGWTPPSRPAAPPPYPPVPVVPLDRPGLLDDVSTRLLKHRVVLVAGTLDSRTMTDAAAQLMLLDATGDDPIELRLMCPGGDLDAALALADTIDLLGVEVRACAAGVVGGAALAPLVAGTTRVAHPHATFVLRDPNLCVSGRAEDVALTVAQHRQQLGALHSRLATACAQPPERIAQDMRTGVVLSAEEAIHYGLVGDIVAFSTHRTAPGQP